MCSTNEYLAIQLIGSPSEAGCVYFFTFFNRLFSMHLFVTMIYVKRN